MTQMAIAVDLDRCLGCHSCTVACMQEHNLPSGSFRIQVIRVGPTMIASANGRPYLEMYYLPVLCQQCENPQCVKVCPTGASSQREDGVVIIDKKKCIGCQFCAIACPYGQCHYDEQGVIEKCTMCMNLLEKGEKPACVKVCMGKCISFGDIDDPDSLISRKIKEAGESVHAMVDFGNRPTVRYILHKSMAKSGGGLREKGKP